MTEMLLIFLILLMIVPSSIMMVLRIKSLIKTRHEINEATYVGLVLTKAYIDRHDFKQ